MDGQTRIEINIYIIHNNYIQNVVDFKQIQIEREHQHSRQHDAPATIKHQRLKTAALHVIFLHFTVQLYCPKFLHGKCFCWEIRGGESFAKASFLVAEQEK